MASARVSAVTSNFAMPIVETTAYAVDIHCRLQYSS